MKVERKEGYRGNPLYEVSSEKSKAIFYVKKTNDGFAFFDVSVSIGQVPGELTGRYSTPEKGVEAVKNYIRVAKETRAARRENFSKARDERKNAKKQQPDNTEHVQ